MRDALAPHVTADMVPAMLIDTTFDFRTDTPPGRDPDAHSPTLRRYHRLLWSKPLPSGAPFALEVTTTGACLHHRSALGEFFLSSDAVIPSFSRERRVAQVIGRLPEAEVEAFNRLGYTIGGMMVFPANRVGRSMTINGARGLHPRIKDRFDLTLECIRRHYSGESSPLAATLARYGDFFALFDDFAGYVRFFLLQDLVDEGAGAVRFSLPFDGFSGSPLPATLDEYVDYRRRAMGFIHARNRRIAEHVAARAG